MLLKKVQKKIKKEYSQPYLFKEFKLGLKDWRFYLGRLGTLLSWVTYNKYIGQKKEKQYIAVGTVQIFIETSGKHLGLKD